MKSLVVYDSQFGNTEKIAQAIGKGLGSDPNQKVIHVREFIIDDLTEVDLLVVGCPTQRLNATPSITEWIKSLPSNALSGIRGASFDTRFTQEKINETSRILAFFVRIFGYAAKPIASQLTKKGAEVILDPEGFYVVDTEGPLLENEQERAEAWAEKMLEIFY